MKSLAACSCSSGSPPRPFRTEACPPWIAYREPQSGLFMRQEARTGRYGARLAVPILVPKLRDDSKNSAICIEYYHRVMFVSMGKCEVRPGMLVEITRPDIAILGLSKCGVGMSVKFFMDDRCQDSSRSARLRILLDRTQSIARNPLRRSLHIQSVQHPPSRLPRFCVWVFW